MECHLPAPPGEEPLQPGEGEVRFGVQLNQVWCHQAKSGDIPANDESVCGLHNDFLAPTFPFSRSSYSDPLPTFDLTGCTALSLTPAPVPAWLKSGTSPGLLLQLLALGSQPLRRCSTSLAAASLASWVASTQTARGSLPPNPPGAMCAPNGEAHHCSMLSRWGTLVEDDSAQLG